MGPENENTMHELCILHRIPHNNGETGGASRQGNNRKRIVRNMEERNVDMKEKSHKNANYRLGHGAPIKTRLQ